MSARTMSRRSAGPPIPRPWGNVQRGGGAGIVAATPSASAMVGVKRASPRASRQQMSTAVPMSRTAIAFWPARPKTVASSHGGACRSFCG